MDCFPPCCLPGLGSLPHMVHDLRPDEYLIEVHLKCPSETNNAYDRTIRLRSILVLGLDLFGNSATLAER